jgi:hypothetical protein
MFRPSAPAAKTQNDYLTEFNRQINLLVNELVRLFPEDPKIDRAKKRINLASREFPDSIIKIVGPVLYGYQEQLYSGEKTFFLDRDYDERVRTNKDAEKVDLSLYIIPKVKEHLRRLGTEEQDEYLKRVVNILDLYVEWSTYGM